MRLILTGVIFLIGGLSGTLALRGTGSSGLLALVGLVMIVMGAVSASQNNGDGYSAEPSDADRERDAEQWAEYQRVRAEQAAQQQQRQAEAAEAPGEDPVLSDDPRAQRVQALILMTPGAKEQIDDLMERTGAHLSADERLNLALETARRLHAAHISQAYASAGLPGSSAASHTR